MNPDSHMMKKTTSKISLCSCDSSPGKRESKNPVCLSPLTSRGTRAGTFIKGLLTFHDDRH